MDVSFLRSWVSRAVIIICHLELLCTVSALKWNQLEGGLFKFFGPAVAIENSRET